MSVVKIQSNASNTGIFTLQSPDSSSDRTLTLPDAAGTFISSGNLTDITNVGTLGSGLTVTGTITSDGLTVDSNEKITLGAYGGEASIIHQSPNDGGGIDIKVGGTLTARFLNSKNIAFYEDTGTTAKFYWDASSERLGIGTTSPSNPLHVENSSSTVATGYFRNTSGAGDSPGLIVQGGANNTNTVGTFEVRDYDGNTDFYVGGTGNVGIGTTSPAHKLHVASAAGNGNDAYMAILTGGSGGTSANHDLGIYFGSTNQSIRTTYDGNGVARGELIFVTSGSENMHIDNGGRVKMQNQPSFRVGKSTTVSGASSIITYDTVYHNVGGHYNTSSGRFTAPVTGVYYFGAQGISGSNSTTNEQNYKLRKNGNDVCDSRALGYTQSSFHIKTIIQLAIGDYVDIVTVNSNTSTYPSAFHNQFMGYLIG